MRSGGVGRRPARPPGCAAARSCPRRWCRPPARAARRPRGRCPAGRPRTSAKRACRPVSPVGGRPAAAQVARLGLAHPQQGEQADVGRAARPRRAGGRRPRSGPGRSRTRARCRATSRPTSSGSIRWPVWGRSSRTSPASSASSTTVVHAAGQPLAGARDDDPRHLLAGAQQRSAGARRGPRSAPGCRAPPGPARGSSASRSASSAASVAPAVVPTASCRPAAPPASRACGSHLTQSHSSRPSGSVRTATVRSAGPCRTAAWHTSARARLSAWPRSPDDPDDAALGQRRPRRAPAAASRARRARSRPRSRGVWRSARRGRNGTSP